jgi:hypothetical protein
MFSAEQDLQQRIGRAARALPAPCACALQSLNSQRFCNQVKTGVFV